MRKLGRAARLLIRQLESWRSTTDSMLIGSKKNVYYIVYDYGMGGRWGVMHADSEDQISVKYPEVAVMRDRPAWMTGDLHKMIEENNSFDIDDEPRGWLKSMMEGKL